MPIFKYQASDKYGITFVGQMTANNVADVITRLKKRKIYPIKVKQLNIKTRNDNKVTSKKGEPRNRLSYRIDPSRVSAKTKVQTINYSRIKPRDVLVFTQNLYLLKRADFNNVHALSTILNTVENVNLKMIVEDMLLGVEAGQNMYTTMEYYPEVFPAIYVGIIKAGEQAGTLVNSLENARSYLESSTKLKAKLKSILVPNIAQFVFINILLVIGMIVVLPEVENIYASFGLTDNLPETTKVFVNIMNFLGSIWYIIVGVLVSIIVVTYLYTRTPEGKYKLDLYKYKMPIFGRLILLLDLQKFLNALYLNLSNGIRLQECMETCKDVVKNTVFLSVIESSRNNLILGEDWIDPFERIQLFPPMVPEMLKLGMETDITEMVSKIEEYISIDIDRTLEATIKLLPEVSYAFVGVMIVILVLVIMVPVMEVYMGSFLFDVYL